MNIEIEVLTEEEFIGKLKIGKTTYHKWVNEGILRPGQDFFKEGKIIRLIWGPDLIKHLLERSSQRDDREDSEDQTESTVSTKKGEKVRPLRRNTGINWEY